jgi:hypothetical protein
MDFKQRTHEQQNHNSLQELQLKQNTEQSSDLKIFFHRLRTYANPKFWSLIWSRIHGTPQLQPNMVGINMQTMWQDTKCTDETNCLDTHC